MLDAARNLHWQGWRITSIAKRLNIKHSTVDSWKERGKRHLAHCSATLIAATTIRRNWKCLGAPDTDSCRLPTKDHWHLETFLVIVSGPS
ncbi:terminase gpP N-terminus-related DNA-binding protein [Collimonas humicola]|uniref:terminase gpP N-terminus-related DNA-binding protein n=1 Tax=Collimonas humicola TaxID=2825886 RepID=UPI001E3A1A87|nr:hypothetical protein [Collimonas humicola]